MLDASDNAPLAPDETPRTEAAAPSVHAGHPPAWIFNAADFLARIAGPAPAPGIKRSRGPP
jgi:hypothetical protein